MKIVSFNVNSVRLRLHQLAQLIATHDPAIIGLQETKVTNEDFPVEAINELGYECVFHGQKTHYGVATLSKLPIEQHEIGLSVGPHQTQSRLIKITTTWNDQPLTVFNGYFPQGENRDHPTKFYDKQRFYQDLMVYLSEHHRPDEALAVIGDLNIAPTELDIGIDNPDAWLKRGACSFLPEERMWIEQLYQWGLTDSYRHLHPEGRLSSWFDYRTRAFSRSHKPGLRIDHILVTQPLLERATDSSVDYDVRGMEKPSDHAPVWIAFE